MFVAMGKDLRGKNCTVDQSYVYAFNKINHVSKVNI